MMRKFLSTMTESLNIKHALDVVKTSIRKASKTEDPPRLVAVTKTKPVEAIYEAYEHGQRHFGENYVQELDEKGHTEDLISRCSDIRWHFIGHLQRNKVNKVLSVPNLYMIETIDSEKLARAVDATWQRLSKDEPLRVMLQVNTSAEPQKQGCSPSAAPALASIIHEECDSLHLVGLMTIGSFDHDLSTGPNPDFLCLVKCREDVCNKLNVPIERLELSMGMSHDYEHAIELGSTNVRVGSVIFGARDYSQKKKEEPKPG